MAGVMERSRVRRVVAGALVVAIVLPLGVAGLVSRAIHKSRAVLDQRQRVLLYQTNHQQLMEACRAVWASRETLGSATEEFVTIDPASGRLPAAIVALSAHAIVASPSGVNIELGGQGEHYGFCAFFDDIQNDPRRMDWTRQFPSTQLLPGFYYYAENGVVKAAAGK
jgi:hypothetical protein